MKQLKTVVVICAILAIAFTGCSLIGKNIAKQAIEKATNGKVNVNDKSVTVKGKNGESTTFSGNQKLPDDFPSDFPKYEKGKIQGSASNAGNNAGIVVTYSSEEKTAAIIDFFKTELPKDGWKITANASYTGVSSIAAEKGTKKASITVTEASGKTTLMVSITTASQ